MKVYTEAINVKLRPETKKNLEEMADNMGISVSTLMRKAAEMVLKRKGK